MKKKKLKRVPLKKFRPTDEQTIYLEENYLNETDKDLSERFCVKISQIEDYRVSNKMLREHETSEDVLRMVRDKIEKLTTGENIKKMSVDEILKIEKQIAEDEKSSDITMSVLEDSLDKMAESNPEKTFEFINQTIDISALPLSKRKVLFEENFKNSYYGKAILDSLEPKEKKIFFEQLLSFLDYTDDLTPPEMQTLALMCLEIIRQLRILKEERKLAKKGDSSMVLQKEYNESVGRLNKYQQNLKVTRDQRLNSASDGRVDIVKLLHAFKDEKTHKKAVQEAALYDYISNVYEKGAVEQGFFKKG